MRQHVAVYQFCCICRLKQLFLQSYPAMLVLASKQDSIIPFEGVQKYVSKLKLCVQQHQSNTGQELRTKRTWVSLLSTNARMFTKSPISRGTVLFHIDKHHNHHGSGENTQTLKEVVYLLPHRASLAHSQVLPDFISQSWRFFSQPQLQDKIWGTRLELVIP